MVLRGYVFYVCFIVFYLATVNSQTEYLHYDCYGIGLMDASCNATSKIFPLEVSVGTKPNDYGCPIEYTADLNFTEANHTYCCRPAENDQCYGVYETVGGQSSLVYHENCVGRSACLVNLVTRVDTVYLGCSNTEFPSTTTYMAMTYHCIDDSTIGLITNTENKVTDGSASSKLQLIGQNYGFPMTSGSSGSCSVEALNCTASVSVTLRDIRLQDENGTCRQSVMISDGQGEATKSLTCDDNNNFTLTNFYTSISSHIMVTLDNTLSDNGGFLWIEFGTREGVPLEMKCPGQPPRNNCTDETTTEIMTTEEATTEITTEEATTEMTTEDATTDLTTEDETTEMTTQDATTDLTTEDETTEMTTQEATTEMTTEYETTDLTDTTDLTTEDGTTELTTEDETEEMTTNQSVKIRPISPVEESTPLGLPMIIGLAVGGLVVLIVIVVVTCIVKKKCTSKQKQNDPENDRTESTAETNSRGTRVQGTDEEKVIKNGKLPPLPNSTRAPGVVVGQSESSTNNVRKRKKKRKKKEIDKDKSGSSSSKTGVGEGGSAPGIDLTMTVHGVNAREEMKPMNGRNPPLSTEGEKRSKKKKMKKNVSDGESLLQGNEDTTIATANIQRDLDLGNQTITGEDGDKSKKKKKKKRKHVSDIAGPHSGPENSKMVTSNLQETMNVENQSVTVEREETSKKKKKESKHVSGIEDQHSGPENSKMVTSNLQETMNVENQSMTVEREETSKKKKKKSKHVSDIEDPHSGPENSNVVTSNLQETMNVENQSVTVEREETPKKKKKKKRKIKDLESENRPLGEESEGRDETVVGNLNVENQSAAEEKEERPKKKKKKNKKSTEKTSSNSVHPSDTLNLNED